MRAYYDHSWFDYRLLWLNGRTLALHFGFYDDGARHHSAALLRMNAELAGVVVPRPGERVLDAGCGVGGSAIWLARTHQVEVVGISPVQSQVERARRFARRRGVAGQVTFEQRDYLDNRFPDASFDIVWAQESVAHTDRKARFLSEAFRVLKPGGRLVVADFFRPHRSLSEIDERRLAAAVADWATPDFSTQQEFVGWVGDAGFRDVQCREITEHVRPSLQRLYRVTMCLYPIGAALHAVRLRGDEAHANMRGSIRLCRTFDDGLWGEAIVSARKP